MLNPANLRRGWSDLKGGCRRGATLGALAGLAMLCSACTVREPKPASLAVAESRTVRNDGVEEVRELTLRDARGRPVRAYLRMPSRRTQQERLPGVVLVAGRETGRQAAAVIPGPLRAVVLAVEYPEAIPSTASVGSIVRRLPDVRDAALRMPGVLTGAARLLASQAEVDSTRLVLVGVSFGVPFAAWAGRDPLFRGVALHHGGADLALLFRTNLPIANSLLRRVVAALLARYFHELEPARHVPHIAPRPLLLVNGTYDDLVPRASALRLAQAARPPLRHLWLPHGHLMPGDQPVMRELADSTLSHFRFLRR